MKFDVLGLLAACSYALDCVEAELIKVTNNHSKRVAYMAVCTAEKNGYTGSKPAGSGRVCIAARQCSGTIYSGRLQNDSFTVTGDEAGKALYHRRKNSEKYTVS